ncbi:hypothetical protein CANARDRAFT_27788 [[Candida] arabinofermentans NRRL YB-2248]|uniref:Pirin n=1 Tax=[Candida] arabinofermentans NRRL YB-2248 TaxID=983967 RepID=A0A1E4T1Q2_9ASCO|nr:hypothetical protein CANARDRAFT_27788 [[Candida] arabinofermentans NRRL YB-2248]
MVALRTILKSLYALEQSEGVGARVRRSIGTMQMRNFTPFLMLDHFNVPPEAGFPDHPHRGQETITLVIKGKLAHEDFTGSKGTLDEGDLQFMTAGKGVVHSEMPFSEDGSSIEGMQLWVDLPEELKDCAPRYRDLRAQEIPIAKPNDKVEVKVISGESYGIGSVKDLAYTPVVYYEYTVQPGGTFYQELPTDFNSFLYILNGSLNINGKELPEHYCAFFNRDGDAIEGTVPENSKETKFVIIGGQVLNQPIVQHGPFVATSKEKIYKAFMDYQYGANGFERAKGWRSEIADGVTPELYRSLSHRQEELAKAQKAQPVKDEL